MNVNVKIQAVASALPAHSRSTTEIMPYLDLWLAGQEDRFARKVKKIFENAGVDKRYSIMPPEEVFRATSLEQKNDLYMQGAIQLGEQCLQAALDKAGLTPRELDYIITVSCTGIMIPSLDAYLINSLQMRQDVVRLPVTEMGCVAGVSAMIYATEFLKANPGRRAAVIAVESPTATFQLDDFSMANIVSAAIFGDGAACAILSSHADDEGPAVTGTGMYHFFEATHLMGFHLSDTGLKMVLDKEVPEKIADHFSAIIHPFLAENGLGIDDIDHLIFHPGGRKIIETAEALFKDLGKNLDDTRAVLREYGNMSSATVLYVLEKCMNKGIRSGDRGLMLSFGPGFSAQRILLQW